MRVYMCHRYLQHMHSCASFSSGLCMRKHVTGKWAPWHHRQTNVVTKRG